MLAPFLIAFAETATMSTPTPDRDEYTRRVLIFLGLAALFTALFLLLKATFNVFLLVLAALLVCVYFRGFAQWISSKTKLPEGVSLSVMIIATVALLAGFGWLVGSRVASQVETLRESMPGAIRKAEDYIQSHEWSRQAWETMQQKRQTFGVDSNALKRIQAFFGSTFGFLGDFYVVMFIGIFFTAAPQLYRKGIEQMFPREQRERAGEVLDRIWNALRGWLAGQLLAMTAVAVLTGTGLVVMGIPAALTLALVAGLLNFIPNLGPLLAMIPALLVTVLTDPGKLWMVAALYIGVQVAESNFITPMVQKKMIEIPPALILIAQIVMGVLTGFLGVLLAVPILAIVIVLVKSLYKEDTLKESAGKKN